ncbi:MAG: flippase-like domain-containing protein [Chloroflexi bacterium]|nr:flippase-like domain-containing protein [Chloroflexota bacterium]
MRNVPLHWRRQGQSIVVWALALVLLAWVLQHIDFHSVWKALQVLSLTQIGILVAVNMMIVLLLSSRWWLLLRGLGYRLPYLRLAGYRLAAFAVSYFTPGPQFGGEPLQVWLPQRQHRVPGTTATVAVVLDKTLDMLVNFTILAAGAMLVVWSEWVPIANKKLWFGFALALLCLPTFYLALAWQGKQPLTRLGRWLRLPSSLTVRIQPVETQIAAFCQGHGREMMAALVVSLLSWAVMIFEYGLMVHFLQIPFNWLQILLALTAARFAFLVPLPGGLGALEASQVFAISTLGGDPAAGAALALLIRARDVLLGLGGLFLGTRYLAGRRKMDGERVGQKRVAG